MSQKKGKVTKIKKPIYSRAGKAIIFFLAVYIVILIVSYVTKEHVSIYEVNETQIADDLTFTGVAIRSETVVNMDQDGYVSYFIPSGNRVGVNQVVYAIDSSGSLASMVEEVDNNKSISEEDVSKVRNVIQTYQSNYDPAHYDEVYNYQYDMSNTIFELTNANLYTKLNEIMKKKGMANNFIKVKSQSNGIISYLVDGMDGLKATDVNKSTFEKEASLAKKQLQTTSVVHKGDPAYRMVTDDKWSVVVPITAEYYKKLAAKKTVNVTFKKDNISLLVSLELSMGTDGQYYATITTSKYMQRYINDRFLDIEFNLNKAKGLKIPNSSILEKEFYVIPANFVTKGGNSNNLGVLKTKANGDTSSYEFVELENTILQDGNYYVSKKILQGGDTLLDKASNQQMVVSKAQKLVGVYQANNGSCTFKRIDVMYKNSEYTIVSNETANGLAVYDHIIMNPEKLDENDFIS